MDIDYCTLRKLVSLNRGQHKHCELKVDLKVPVLKRAPFCGSSQLDHQREHVVSKPFKGTTVQSPTRENLDGVPNSLFGLLNMILIHDINDD